MIIEKTGPHAGVSVATNPEVGTNPSVFKEAVDLVHGPLVDKIIDI